HARHDGVVALKDGEALAGPRHAAHSENVRFLPSSRSVRDIPPLSYMIALKSGDRTLRLSTSCARVRTYSDTFVFDGVTCNASSCSGVASSNFTGSTRGLHFGTFLVNLCKTLLMLLHSSSVVPRLLAPDRTRRQATRRAGRYQHLKHPQPLILKYPQPLYLLLHELLYLRMG
ncbi:MAG: hypothetical protein RL242_2205, partial [Pseudomonadota bacterium]